MTVSFSVLVAEDDAPLAHSMSDLLEAEGCAVALALDGAAALQMALSLGQKLDVLVTDLNMPGMTGSDLIRAISVMRPSLPVVVVTGSAPPGGLDELRDMSGGHRPLTLLHKPAANSDLLAALQSAVATCRALAPDVARGGALRLGDDLVAAALPD